MNEIFFYVVVALAIGIVCGYFIKKFIEAPSNSKIEMIKNWLLYATAQAEQEMGAGTGRLKLAKVYDMFVEKFPQIAAVLKYEKFCEMVDEALVTLRHLLETNVNIQEFISFGEKVV